MSDPAKAYIALGANMGEPALHIMTALSELDQLPSTNLIRHSAIYRSQAEGYLDQPDFLNAVAEIRTDLTPRALLDALLAIELRHGRERAFRNAPRTLDLDILLYDDLILDQTGLHLPHPRMHLRAFVLVPLHELAPHAAIPGKGTAQTWLDRLSGPLPSRVAQADLI